MNKKIGALMLLSILLLAGCDTNETLSDPLNIYESKLVSAGIVKNFSSLSSTHSAQTSSEDWTIMYGKADSSLADKSDKSNIVDCKIGSNHAYTVDISVSEEERDNGLTVKSGYEAKRTLMALHNPDSLLDTDSNYYNLYEKEEQKDAGYSYFGTNYFCNETSFSTKDDIDTVFDEYIVGLFNTGVANTSSYYRTSSGFVGAYSMVSTSTIDNALYPGDSTKKISVNSITIYKATITSDYHLSNLTVTQKYTPTLTYQMEANSQAVSSISMSCDYKYETREAITSDLSAEICISEEKNIPILETYRRTDLASDWYLDTSMTFSNNSQIYQMTLGEGYHYSLLYPLKENTGLVAYAVKINGFNKTSNLTFDDIEKVSYQNSLYFNIVHTGTTYYTFDIIETAKHSIVSAQVF